MPSDGSPPASRSIPGLDGASPRSWVRHTMLGVDGGDLDGHSHDGQLFDGHPHDAARPRAAEEISRLEETLATAEKSLGDLQAAVQSNRRIGMAIGILMALRKVPEETAFDLLRRASSVRNVKLRLVAEEVIRTGTVE